MDLLSNMLNQQYIASSIFIFISFFLKSIGFNIFSSLITGYDNQRFKSQFGYHNTNVL